jgi:hypothetical protein
VENAVENVYPNDCECHGTGWIEVDDPIVGAIVVARCPGPEHARQLNLWEPHIS